MPMETDTIEFQANADGDWFSLSFYIIWWREWDVFFSYEIQRQIRWFTILKWLQNAKMDDRMFHFMAENDFATNGNDGEAMFSNTLDVEPNGDWVIMTNMVTVETHIRWRYLRKKING